MVDSLNATTEERPSPREEARDQDQESLPSSGEHRNIHRRLPAPTRRDARTSFQLSTTEGAISRIARVPAHLNGS